MEYCTLGTTGLRASRLGLGTVELGMPYGLDMPPPPPDAECIRLLRGAYEAGITFFDTAAAYGRSEELVGAALAALSPRPVIATKATLIAPDSSIPLRGRALRQHLEHSVARSLQRLQVEAVDLLQFHSLEPAFVTTDLLDVVEDLTRRGWVRHWGASTYEEEAPRAIAAAPGPLRSLQLAYSLLDRRLERKVLPACRRAGMGVVFRSIFLKGVLTDRMRQLPPRLAPLRQAALKAGEIAAAASLSLPAMALRFAAFSPFTHVTLFGTASLRELEANLAAFAAGPLPPDVLEALNAVEVAEPSLLNPSTWED
jgi:aryl-alcohol dehydrogenase-like predicted oxidoreductase